MTTEDRQCTATNRQGGRCKRWAIRGGTVCAMHGGKIPNVKAAAERRLAEREALLALEAFGIPIEVDPHTALLQELHRTAGAVAWVGAIVAGLSREEEYLDDEGHAKDTLVWGITKQKQGGDDEGTTWEAKPNIWYELWARERKHLTEVAAACVKAGIEERRIQLAEDQGRLLAVVIQKVLGRLNLDSAQQALVAQVVPEELRAVAALEAGA